MAGFYDEDQSNHLLTQDCGSSPNAFNSSIALFQANDRHLGEAPGLNQGWPWQYDFDFSALQQTYDTSTPVNITSHLNSYATPHDPQALHFGNVGHPFSLNPMSVRLFFSRNYHLYPLTMSLGINYGTTSKYNFPTKTLPCWILAQSPSGTSGAGWFS